MQQQTTSIGNIKSTKRVGFLLIAGAVGVLVPYTILTMSFEYPDILRQDTGTILGKFHDGGSSLIFTWWAFAILGLPLLFAYKSIGQKLEDKSSLIAPATTIGVISIIVQLIGLLRWVFVVPVIANNYVNGDPMARQAAITSFQTIHQFGGVLLGEHIGQLFTITWTVIISAVLIRSNYFSQWIGWLGIIASVIYLLAQAELFATVIPGFPVWGPAGFIGSTLWLIWLIVLGVLFIRRNNN